MIVNLTSDGLAADVVQAAGGVLYMTVRQALEEEANATVTAAVKIL